MRLLARWLLAAVALLITVDLVPGLELTGGVRWVLVAALALGLLNALVRPAVFLLKVLTLPLSCLTFGLWALLLSVFVNVLVFYFVGSLGWGITTETFGAAVVGSLVMGVLNTVLTGLFELGHRARGR